MTTIDNLKKEAKRWLKALRSNDAEAEARLRHAYPNAPQTPVLRDLQHALALERGAENWKALQNSLTRTSADKQAKEYVTIVERFLEYACWDHHTHGKGDHRMFDSAAQRLLEQHPDIARDSVFTAVVAGDIDEVRRLISLNQNVATEPGGPKGWPPILYLCFTRFTHQPTIKNAVEIARLLLDNGADPNSFYKAGDADYSALVGAAGGGEQDSPRQPQSEELYALLLDRGAGPYDLQVLYNTHFSGDILWWLKLTYERSLKLGLKADWADPNWSMIDMGGYGPSAYFILSVAIRKKDLELAEWALTHGASPNATSAHPKFRAANLYHEAQVERLPEMTKLLERYGADTKPLARTGEEKFIESCFRLDRREVESQLAAHPEYFKSTHSMFAAAEKNRADVIAFLLDLGFPIEIQNQHNQRTLHQAAANNSLEVAQLLIDRGAEIDPRETQWGATPIGWASHGDHVEMIDLLSKYSSNVWTLAFRGYVERLREVLRVQPDLAKQATDEGITPLWWLPDDEDSALEIADLLLRCGADPSAKNKSGNTAADWAGKLGKLKLVAKLNAAMSRSNERLTQAPTSNRFEALAKDLLVAYESGYQPALAHLNGHYRTSLTWEELRRTVQERLKLIPKSELPMSGMYEGYFALPHAQLLVAKSAGFKDWIELHAAQLKDPKQKEAQMADSNIKQAVPFFLVTDMETSLGYYTDGLGFQLKNKWIDEGKLRWCWLELDEVSLMLQEYRPDLKPEGKLGQGVSICFVCEDALKFYHEVKSRSIEAGRPFVGNGMWVTSLVDPDGYRLDFESDTDVAEDTVYDEG